MSVNVVEILVRAKDATAAGFGEAEASAAGMSKAISKAGLIAAGGLAVIGVEAVRMATDFQSSMTQLSTQAGVPKAKIASLSAGVLQLAGQVGFSPDSLAESLYHVASNMESVGGTSKQMLAVVKTAAEGAKVGNADLVDVTNALTAAVASGIPGVKNYSQAMGMLNATVGSGDMKMQDLAEAFGGGMVATVKGFGLSLKDVGAALATFGDNNIRGAHAGTQLRMSVMALASPVLAGQAQLKKWGDSSNQLAKDMQSGGLMKALNDLHGLFIKNGVTAKEQGEVITNMFGKKAGAGLNVLMDQLDRLKSKYPAITKGANDFGKAWTTTSGTLKQQLSDLRGGFDALMVTIGDKLIPVVQSIVSLMLKHKQATLDVLMAVGALAGVLATLAVVIKTVEIATKAWALIQAVLDAELLANPIVLIAAGLVLLVVAIVEAYKHFKVFRDVVQDVFNWIKGHWQLLLAILTGPIGAAVIFIVDHWQQIVTGVVSMFNAVRGWFERIPGMILSALGDVGSLLLHAGESIISGLLHGIESAAGGVLSYVKGLAGDISGAFSSVLHILSPSKVFDEHGRNIVRGLVQGIDGEAPTAVAAMRRVGLAGLPGGVGAVGAGALGAGGVTRLQIEFVGGDGPIIEAFKNAIRIRGGGGINSVQKALGQMS